MIEGTKTKHDKNITGVSLLPPLHPPPSTDSTYRLPCSLSTTLTFGQTLWTAGLIHWHWYQWTVYFYYTDTTNNVISTEWVFFLFCFLAFNICRFCVVIRFFSSPPQRPMTSDFEGFFYLRFYPLHLFSYLNSWERASIFPFECSVLNKWTFITSLVWRGPWLGIEPGTSRTRSQHYTTRISRRRYKVGVQ